MNLKFLFFGHFSEKINYIKLSNALDRLESKDIRFQANRENCVDMYEIIDSLQYGLEYMDIFISYEDYSRQEEEHKFPIYEGDNVIGFLIIDKNGDFRIIYDKVNSPKLDIDELREEIDLILSCSREDLIDNLMGILQFTRPIPLSSDVFLMNLSSEDEDYIMEFFHFIFDQMEDNKFSKPYFIHIDENIYNLNSIASLIADKMNEVLTAFSNTKDEFYSGLAKDMTLEDIDVIDRLIDITYDDIYFYENILKVNIIKKLDKKNTI